MYIAVLLVVVAEAWLFLSVTLTLYAVVLAIGFHLFVVWYEEPTLSAQFGGEYDDYCHHVSRWIPRPP